MAQGAEDVERHHAAAADLRPPQLEAPQLRHEDYKLSETQAELDAGFGDFLSRRCSLDLVRQALTADVPGHDVELWSDLLAWGVTELATSAGLQELVLVTERAGAALAPVPLVEHSVAARYIASLPAARAGDALADSTAGRGLVTIALQPVVAGVDQLIPSGAIADAVLALAGPQVSLLRGGCVQRPANLGGLPVGRWDFDKSSVTVLDQSSQAANAFSRALTEWRLLTASEMVGIARSAHALAVDYAKQRTTFGTPIGSYQAISHPLVDQAVLITAVRMLVRRAAWFADAGELSAEALIQMAHYKASRVASQIARFCMHVLGGIGMTLESEAHLYLRRSKALALLGGNTGESLTAVADTVLAGKGAHPPLWSKP